MLTQKAYVHFHRGAERGLGPHGHHWQEEDRQAIEEEDGPAEEVGGFGETGKLVKLVDCHVIF
jgi:hypothetical protein